MSVVALGNSDTSKRKIVSHFSALNRLDQWFSAFHCLWRPSKDCQHLCPCSSIGIFNIKAELFSKDVCSWPAENRSMVPLGDRGSRLKNAGLDLH